MTSLNARTFALNFTANQKRANSPNDSCSVMRSLSTKVEKLTNNIALGSGNPHYIVEHGRDSQKSKHVLSYDQTQSVFPYFCRNNNHCQCLPGCANMTIPILFLQVMNQVYFDWRKLIIFKNFLNRETADMFSDNFNK